MGDTTTMAVTAAVLVATVGVLVAALRCRFGWHPPGDIRMRTGRRAGSESVTEWECLRCLRTAAVRTEKVNVPVLRRLRAQAAVRARGRMKVVR